MRIDELECFVRGRVFDILQIFVAVRKLLF